MKIRKVLFTAEREQNAQPSFFVENPDDRNEGSLLRLPPGEEIAGIRFSDVRDIFRATFGAGERVRRRLDGEVQRVWVRFRLDPTVEGAALSSGGAEELPVAEDSA